MKRSFSIMVVGDTDSETNPRKNGTDINNASGSKFIMEEAWMAAIASVTDLQIGKGYAKNMKTVIQNDELVFELVTCFSATASVIHEIGNIDPRSPAFQDLLREVIFSFLEVHKGKLEEISVAALHEISDNEKVQDFPENEIECDLFSAIFDDWH